jgi:hypothetical protein
MVYPYSVKSNGVYYKAGTNVPDGAPKKAEKVDNVGVAEMPSPILVKEEVNQKMYTKTEINRMSTAELQDLAESLGIENARETSGGKLKAKLIEHFGL